MVLTVNWFITMHTDTRLLRLLQLCSATLPVGAYAFSQGLEYAIEQRWLKDTQDVQQWLSVSLSQSLAKTDAPILQRFIQAAHCDDRKSIVYWNNFLLACRETCELRLSDSAMGAALQRLLAQLGLADDVAVVNEPSFAACFAIASARWHIDCKTATKGYLWCWLENQVSAATKLLPMGQTCAQQLLFALADEIPAAMIIAGQIADDDIGSSLPTVAMASAWHETQYSRLYRS